MARDHAGAIAIGLGVGGGALLWYLLRGHKGEESSPTTAATSPAPDSTASPPSPPSPSSIPPGAPPATSSTAPAPVRTPGACQLRLDTDGITSGGAPLTVAGALDLCKPAGKADLVYAHDAPAASLTDVYRALTDAGVSVVVWAP